MNAVTLPCFFSDSFTSSETITTEQPLGFHSGLIRVSFGIHSGFKKQAEMVGFCCE